MLTTDGCSLHSCFFPLQNKVNDAENFAYLNQFPLQINDEISVWLMTALGFKWSHL